MPHPADLAIRLARAAFNRALAEANLAAITPILSPGAILITGTDSAALITRKAQLQAWKREFAATPRTLYTRTPTTIEASPIEPIALEHGTWTGTTGPTPLASGTYTAKWRNLAPQAPSPHWVIEAEIYLTLA